MTTISRAASVLFGLFMVALGGAGCELSLHDEFPAIGRPCKIRDGLCDVDHVCHPEAAGSVDGVCMPVEDFGGCDKPTWPAGRQGKTEQDRTKTEISGADDVGAFQEVRLLGGDLLFNNATGSEVEIGAFCGFTQLQRIEGMLMISETDATTLDGLQSLTTLGDILVISSNDSLTSLEGLKNLVEVGSRDLGPVDDRRKRSVVIAGNHDLQNADAADFVDALARRMNDDTLKDRAVLCGNRGSVDPCPGGNLTFLEELLR